MSGPHASRNRRRTVARQLARVEARAAALARGEVVPEPFVPRCVCVCVCVCVCMCVYETKNQLKQALYPSARTRRCRSCGLTSEQCDGLCWGFWKESRLDHQYSSSNLDCPSEMDDGGVEVTDGVAPPQQSLPPLLHVAVGDRVRRGPAWAPRYANQVIKYLMPCLLSQVRGGFCTGIGSKRNTLCYK